jgi:hypothetical protein
MHMYDIHIHMLTKLHKQNNHPHEISLGQAHTAVLYSWSVLDI